MAILLVKLIKWAFLTLTLFTLVLNSCKNSSDSTPKTINSLFVKFNGTAYSTTDVEAVTDEGTLTLVGVVNSNVERLDINGGLKVG